MNESIVVAKEVDAKKGFLSTHRGMRAFDAFEMILGSSLAISMM